MARPRSIRWDLTIWLLGPLIALSVVMLGEAFLDLRARSTAAYDRLLATVAMSIAQDVHIGDSESLMVDLPFPTLAYSDSFSSDHLFYSVSLDGSDQSFGYPDLPLPQAAPNVTDTPIYYDTRYRDEPVRAVMIVGRAISLDSEGRYRVIVAETLGQRSGEVRAMLARSTIRLSVLIFAASLIVWFGVRKGLRPLLDLEASVRRRSPEDLRPIAYETPVETQALVGAVNAFMDRLAQSLSALEAFTGNVGHQLRTPVGVIQTNVALARRRFGEESSRSLLADVEAAARDLGRLIDQLLLMSRIRARRADRAHCKSVDAARLVAETVRDTAPSLLRHGVHPCLSVLSEPLPVRADPILLEGLVTNLIDNVVRHAAPTDLDIRVHARAGRAILEFEDDGPGLPPALARRAFRRHAETTTGHGLGLAICAEIAEHFGGTIGVESPLRLAGTRVVVSLPLATAPSSERPQRQQSS